MTDRVNALTVVLDKDMRVDDIEHMIAAISMLKGVKKVSMHITDVADHVADVRAKREVRDKLYALIDELKA